LPSDCQKAQARQACKKLICTVEHLKKAEGEPVACKVLKDLAGRGSERKYSTASGSGARGHAKCEAELKLDRSLIAKVMDRTQA
jgi:hypothetical protein